MAEEYQTPETQPTFLNKVRSLCGYGLVLVALACMAFAGLWMVTDFFAAAVYSPNLEPASRVADFNDFAYVSETIRGYRISIGIPVLLTAISSVCLAVLLLRRNGAAKPIYVMGAVVVLSAILVLSRVFYWPIFLLLVLAFVALYLATEWHRLTARTVSDLSRSSEAAIDDSLVAPESLDNVDSEDNLHHDALAVSALEASSDLVADKAISQPDDSQINVEDDVTDAMPADGGAAINLAAADAEEQTHSTADELPLEKQLLEPSSYSNELELEDIPPGSLELETVGFSEDTLDNIRVELPITENVDSAAVVAEHIDNNLPVSLDPEETQPNVNFNEVDYLAEPAISPDDTHELDEALIPIVSEKVSGAELADPKFNSDTEFMLESRMLEPDTVTTDAPKPTAETKTKKKAPTDESEDVVKPARKQVRNISSDEVRPDSKKKRKKHKKASGWKSWNLLDWVILTLIAMLILGIAGLLLAG